MHSSLDGDAGNDRSQRRKDVRLALENARKNDAAWFRKVFGENNQAFSYFEEDDDDDDDDDDEEYEEDEKDKVVEEVEEPVEKRQIGSTDSESQLLESLGYTIGDVESMRSSIRRIIIEKKIRRPGKGLPSEWSISRTPGSVNGRGKSQSSNYGSAANKNNDNDNYLRNEGRRDRRFAGTGSDSSERYLCIVRIFVVVKQGNNQIVFLSDIVIETAMLGNSALVSFWLSLYHDHTLSISSSSRRKTKMNAGEDFSWRGAPPTVVEMEKRISAEDDSLDSELGRRSDGPNTFWPDEDVSHFILH